MNTHDEARIDDNGNGNGLPPPEIDGVVPDRGPPGTTVVVTGTEFRVKSPVSSVAFGAAFAPIVSWTRTRVEVHVPPVESIGAAGLTDLILTSSAAESATAPFTVLDTTPPRITGTSRDIGLPGDELRIFGERFGTDGTEGRAVQFDGIGVPFVFWAPGEIRLRVPELAAVGGPGAKTVRVVTLWGTAVAERQFTVAEPPAIVSVSPALAPPDAELTIEGRGFGAYADGGSRALLRFVDEDTGEIFEASMEVREWTPTTIVAIVPGLRLLKTSGTKSLVVSTPLGSSAPVDVTIGDVGSITSWTRIEPHARTEDLDAGLEAGLRAALADPLWLVGRQWATGQLFGEDAGSVVVARLQGEHAPLDRWRPGRSGPAEELPKGTPLETLVERERVFPERVSPPRPFADRRLAVEAGLHFLRAVAARVDDPKQVDVYRRRYIETYGVQALGDTERATLDRDTVRFLTVVAGRAPDGARLYEDLRVALPPERGGSLELPRKPSIRGRDRDQILEAVADWFTWCESLVSEPLGTQTTWDAERMEYAFAVSATLSTGEVVLEAPEYYEGRLDWPAFVRGSERLDPEDRDAAGTTFSRAVLPSPVTYPGMPAPRFFELEDARVDFGSVDAGPTDVIRLLFVEFAMVYGNDWFAIPVDGIPAGSLLRVTSLRVTDVFGVDTTVAPFTESGEGGAWRMFHVGSNEGDDSRDLLFVPATLASSVESSPTEEVTFVRDELANLGWAVERIVTSTGGRPLRRHEQYAEARQGAANGATPSPSAGLPELAYRLMTPVPDYWIPLIPRDEPAPRGRRMVRAAMRRPRPDGGFDPIPPLGRILEPERASLAIHDEEIPRDGARVTRTWQLARNAAGETFLWLGLRKEAGSGEASSGLRFDVVETRSPPPA